MARKIRVLFLANIPSPYRVDFFNELGRQCELTVLFERDSSDERDSNWYNTSFKNFNAVFLKGKKVNKNTALCMDVTKYLKRGLFDIFIVGGYSTPTGMLAIEILRMKKIPFILNTDGGIIKKDNMLKYLIKKHFIGSANYWLSTGKYTTDYLINYGAIKSKVFQYPFTSICENELLVNPLNENMKSKIKRKLNIREDKVVLSIGRFIESKGFDVLLNACKHIPKDCGVYIIGGEPTNEYISLKNKLELSNVHFIGFQNKEALKEYFFASDLFVLPTREDIWGLVINEAMAYGLPIITTNNCVAGLELVRDNVNGFIVPVNSSSALGTRISDVLIDPELKERMSKLSIERIKSYTIENMSEVHLKIFNSILNKELTNVK